MKVTMAGSQTTWMTRAGKLALAALVACSMSALAFAQAKPASNANNKVVTLGALGQTLNNATIHSSANSRARVFYRLKPYEYLVVRKSKYSGWHNVLMQNGRWGFIKSTTVAELPYTVTQNVDLRTSTYTGSARIGAAGSTSRAAAARDGLNYQGTPYQWGGNDPLNGIDCSAFVKYLYGKIGIQLPRTAAQQALVGTPITNLEDLQPGDRLYFWENRRNKIGHTGIYLGNGYFVHSSSGRKGVATDYLGSPKWRNILVAARR